MYISDVLGMLVVDCDSGTKVGYVSDIKFNNSNGMIESLIVSEGKNRFICRLFSYFKKIEIYRENIMMFGVDLVVVKTY